MATLPELKREDIRRNVLRVYENFYWIHVWIVDVCARWALRHPDVERKLELIEQAWEERNQMIAFKREILDLGFDWDALEHDAYLFESMRARYRFFLTTEDELEVIVGMNLFSEGVFGVTELEELHKCSPELFPRFPEFAEEEERHAEHGRDALLALLDTRPELLPHVQSLTRKYQAALIDTTQEADFAGFLQQLIGQGLLPRDIIDRAQVRFQRVFGISAEPVGAVSRSLARGPQDNDALYQQLARAQPRFSCNRCERRRCRRAGAGAAALERRVVLGLVLLPFVGLIVAVALLWRVGIGPLEVGTLLAMHLFTMTGITVGYHRLLTHRSFEAKPAVRLLLAIAGSMAGQGPVLFWVAGHRRHHMHSDQPGDPHSPLLQEGRWARIRGLWHAHIGWLFQGERSSTRHFAPDLLQDPAMRMVSRLYFVWMLLGLALPALAGGILSGTLRGAGLGLLWGGLVRIFVGYQLTASVNSICHVFGAQPFATEDGSRNNLWLAFLTGGEGWHNNHHAFPTSAFFGLRWWQIDPGGWVVRLLGVAGLAWNIKSASTQLLEARKK